MTKNIFFSLLRYSLNSESKDAAALSSLSKEDWGEMMKMAGQHSVLGLCLDAFDGLRANGVSVPREILMRWIGGVINLEKVYRHHKQSIRELALFFSQHCLRMVLMKGYGLSKIYPVAAHRGGGDLDVYFCGEGERADELIMKKGFEVKQNEEKHSVYDFRGVHVENHASVICEQEHYSLLKVEKFLKNDLNENIQIDADTGCYLPSVMFNIVFLPLHFAGHFVYGGANLRQVVDYALVVRNASLKNEYIDWEKVKELAVEGGFYDFLCYLNGICVDYIGISANCFPDWKRNKVMQERILNEVLTPQQADVHSLFGKVRRFLNNRWKYQLVYSKESHLTGLLLRGRSWLNWKWGKRSVWDN